MKKTVKRRRENRRAGQIKLDKACVWHPFTPMRQWIEDDVWSTYQFVQKNKLDWTKEITVTGSREDLEKLTPDDIRAYIILSDDDKKPERKWWEGKVHVEFPPGLKVSLAKPVPPVVYWLGKRTDTPPT